MYMHYERIHIKILWIAIISGQVHFVRDEKSFVIVTHSLLDLLHKIKYILSMNYSTDDNK